MAFRKFETPIAGVFRLEPQVFGDTRGYFLELFNAKALAEVGLAGLNFVQDNLSCSSRGTLRGLHFQAPPYAQGKLVTPLTGSVLDVVVDIRRDSPTYGQPYAVELHAEQHQMLYVPPGLAHGFQVLSETCLFFYKCTHFYEPAADGGIAWDDPDLDIPWRDVPPVLSAKDRQHPRLAAFSSPF